MKIEITNVEVRNQSGISQKSGKPYSIDKQVGYLHLDTQHYPVRFEFSLKTGTKPYDVGFYKIKDSSFFVDRFGGLALFGQLELIPALNDDF